MKYQCPLCPKKFTSRNMLRQHTGTNDAALRRAHLYTKCEQTFCSQRAMEQHRDAPSHDTMFTCDVCKRPFGSRQAVEQHNKKSSLHARRLAQANLAVGNVVGASSNPRNPSSYQMESLERATPSTPIKEGTRSSSDSWEEYSDDEDILAEDRPGAVWDEDQNWALCDTDCGWCGHCADGMDY